MAAPTSGPDDLISRAIGLTNLLNKVNHTFSRKDGRIYLKLKRNDLKITKKLEKASTIVDLTELVFNEMLSQLPRESHVRKRLYEQINLYTKNLLSFPESTTERNTHDVEKVKRTIEKVNVRPAKVSTSPRGPAAPILAEAPKKAPVAPHAKRVTFNLPSTGNSLERNRVETSLFFDLIGNPNISIDDLTNAFQKEMGKGLPQFYTQDISEHYEHLLQEQIDANDNLSDDVISAMRVSMQKKQKKEAHSDLGKFRFYLPATFHQILSEVTDLIEAGEITNPQEALEELQEKFEAMGVLYQITDKEESRGKRMVNPLGRHSIQFLRALLLKPDTTDAFMAYFKQIVNEKENE